MRLAVTAQKNRTATAIAAAAAVRSILPVFTVFIKSEASRLVSAVIMAIFAASEIHCAATFPTMYFLLSPTVPISLLLIIILFTPFQYFPANSLYAGTKCKHESSNRKYTKHILPCFHLRVPPFFFAAGVFITLIPYKLFCYQFMIYDPITDSCTKYCAIPHSPCHLYPL